MFTMEVLKFYREEAVLTATYLINRISSRILSFKTPKEVFLETFPYTNLISKLPFKLFRCSAYVHLQSNFRRKFRSYICELHIPGTRRNIERV